jgi:hypothetical protein
MGYRRYGSNGVSSKWALSYEMRNVNKKAIIASRRRIEEAMNEILDWIQQRRDYFFQ